MKKNSSVLTPPNEAGPIVLGTSFRRMSVRERRDYLAARLGVSGQEVDALTGDTNLTDLANVMVESAIGYMAVPMGVAAGFVIDGERVNVPMAVESRRS